MYTTYMNTSQATWAGYTAGYDKKYQEDNPYPHNSLERRNWQFGWDMAIEEQVGRHLHSKGHPEIPEIDGTCGC